MGSRHFRNNLGSPLTLSERDSPENERGGREEQRAQERKPDLRGIDTAGLRKLMPGADGGQLRRSLAISLLSFEHCSSLSLVSHAPLGGLVSINLVSINKEGLSYEVKHPFVVGDGLAMSRVGGCSVPKLARACVRVRDSSGFPRPRGLAIRP